jgi:ABC-type amino acid transport substrate-binding protein
MIKLFVFAFKHFTSAIVIFIFLYSPIFAKSETKLRVGIFQNSPVIFQDTDGITKGFTADFLNEIAKSENWELEYVLCDWNDCLKMLGKREIDIMTSIAHTKERDGFADFTKVVVWSLWGTVLFAT